ncbi:uncharacterized protein N7483_010174 [Penicillium malachiteum]|uniref:uncharacterized protein n=1 Tax=Penicillium malachiteum TaxID=1324776 RepID=UPI0025491D4B|nr:uncharacterized protein N7483_010174 [Penicillium malachiteum]KAJ5712993.1 hypothetical protein N7483_010174 [Penicillium malachiteum]
MKSFLAPLSLFSLLLAGQCTAATIPTRSISKRSTETCDQWGTITTGSYIVYNDLWGEDYATSGEQCVGVTSLSGTDLAWYTTWTWAGGSSNVKSYASAALQFTAATLSSITSIESTWKWSYSTTNIDADVSYDMFLASSATGSDKYEIMVWLAAYGGAGPISSTGSSVGTTTVGGVEFSLYTGPNGDTTVYSFVASKTTTSFSADLKEFFTYLIDNEGLSSSLYLVDVQAGSEPFTGTDATLTVSKYSAAVST